MTREREYVPEGFVRRIDADGAPERPLHLQGFLFSG